MGGSRLYKEELEQRSWSYKFFFYILDFLLSSEVANLRLSAHYAESNTNICILYVEVPWLFCFITFIRIGYCTWVEVDNFVSWPQAVIWGYVCLFREREFHIHMHFFFYYKVQLNHRCRLPVYSIPLKRSVKSDIKRMRDIASRSLLHCHATGIS